MAILHPTAIHKVLDAVHGTDMYLPVFLPVTRAMRLGEILALRWEDIDMLGGQIRVTHSLTLIDSKPVLKEPKTPRSRRQIDVWPQVVKTLKEHRVAQAKERLAAGLGRSVEGFVCSWPDGAPFRVNMISSAFRKLMRGMGFPVRFHDLRHTHASLLLAENVHPKVVSARLGHARIALTLDTYSYILPGLQRQAAEKLEQVLF